MNQVHFIDTKCITSKEQQLLSAAKTARTKLENSINEIKNAIAELQAENIKVTQANVIRRLKGKRSKKTIIQHWKTLFPKQTSEETIFDWRDLANQKPLHQWSNSELGIPKVCISSSLLFMLTI